MHPSPGEVYRHYKGHLYKVIAVAQHTETQEILVVYQAQYGDALIWARPADMFSDHITHQGVEKLRFSLVENRLTAYLTLPPEAYSVLTDEEFLRDNLYSVDPTATIQRGPLVTTDSPSADKDIVPTILASAGAIVSVMLALNQLLKTWLRRPIHCEWDDLEFSPNEPAGSGSSPHPVWKVARKHLFFDPTQAQNTSQVSIDAGVDGVHFRFSTEDSAPDADG